MAKLQNVDIGLSELIKNISKGMMGVPAMQRDFVYKKRDIEALGDSLIRGYPISSMLMMPSNGTLKVKVEPLKTDGATLSEEEYQYVLDGQQRLTSIAKVFLALDAKNEYYFDLLSMLVERFPEDRILDYRFFGDKVRNGKLKPVDETLCVGLKRNNTVNEEFREHYRYISGLTIVENRSASMVNKFLKYLFSEDSIEEERKDDLMDKYMDYLNSMMGGLSGYGVPITIIPADSDLGVVCRVFETVNKTGIRLSAYDLINAKSFSYADYEHGLTEFLRHSLSEFEYATSEEAMYMREFFQFDEERGQFSELARIVRMIEVAHHLERDLQPSIKNSDMLKRDPKFWFDSWVNKRQAFVDYVTFLGKNDLLHGIAPISYFEYIGGIVLNHPKVLEQSDFRELVKRYALYLGFSGNSFNKSNLQTVMDFLYYGRHLLTAKGFESKNFENKPTTSLVIEPQRLKQIKIKQTPFNAVFYIMYREHYRGKFINDMVNSRVQMGNGFDIHHICPRSFGKDNLGLYDSVANLMLIDANSNRNEIKDLSMNDYMDQIRSMLGNQTFEDLAEMNLLPAGMTQMSDEAFIDARAGLLSRYLEGYFNQ